MARKNRRIEISRQVDLSRVGDEIIEQIVAGGLAQAERVSDQGDCVIVWAANASEQIEETIRDRLRRQGFV